LQLSWVLTSPFIKGREERDFIIPAPFTRPLEKRGCGTPTYEGEREQLVVRTIPT